MTFVFAPSGSHLKGRRPEMGMGDGGKKKQKSIQSSLCGLSPFPHSALVLGTQSSSVIKLCRHLLYSLKERTASIDYQRNAVFEELTLMLVAVVIGIRLCCEVEKRPSSFHPSSFCFSVSERSPEGSKVFRVILAC